ncbi:MAG: zinc permease [Thermoplasmata archaeon]|nr:zinc permease [Thermoplasmata archaeon]
MSGPSELQIFALGAFAGFTIYLGMPLARWRNLPVAARAALAAVASGILLFLFADVLSNAHAIVVGRWLISSGASTGKAASLLGLLLVGFALGMLLLQAFERYYGRANVASGDAASVPPDRMTDPLHLSTMIAVGIGFHNFAEGLAIGAAYAAGLSLAVVLVVGFAIHNSTEGFGILGPGMLAGRRYSVRRLAALGAIGGGPTLLGTVAGSLATSDYLSVAFYGLAAGAIMFVVLQMSRPLLAFRSRGLVIVFLVVGFSLGVATDFLVTWGGG